LSQSSSLIPINQLEISKFNPRKERIDPKRVSEISKSVECLGIKEPLLVYKLKGDKKWQIIKGGTRYLAALHLKLKELPCYLASFKSEEEVEIFARTEGHQEPIGLTNTVLKIKEILDEEETRYLKECRRCRVPPHTREARRSGVNKRSFKSFCEIYSWKHSRYRHYLPLRNLNREVIKKEEIKALNAGKTPRVRLLKNIEKYARSNYQRQDLYYEIVKDSQTTSQAIEKLKKLNKTKKIKQRKSSSRKRFFNPNEDQTVSFSCPKCSHDFKDILVPKFETSCPRCSTDFLRHGHYYFIKTKQVQAQIIPQKSIPTIGKKSKKEKKKKREPTSEEITAAQLAPTWESS